MRVINVALFLLATLAITAIASAGISAETYSPGLGFASLLNGISLDSDTGQLCLKTDIRATFLPMAESKSSFPYDPNQGGKLWAVMSDSSGAEVARFDFYAEQLENPYWLLSSNIITVNGQSQETGVVKVAKGSYNLDFFLEGNKFYHFPFAVDVQKSSDPFAGGDHYFLDGDWNNYAYLMIPEGNAEQSLLWKVFLRNKGLANEKDVKVDIKITKDSDGKVLCQNRADTTWTLTPEWVRCDFDLVAPVEKYGEYFKARDLLANDGAYTLTMKIDGQPYGVWHFSVENGALKRTGRADRATADPLTFVEGGLEAAWYSS
jgi:hypothetical protein